MLSKQYPMPPSNIFLKSLIWYQLWSNNEYIIQLIRKTFFFFFFENVLPNSVFISFHAGIKDKA